MGLKREKEREASTAEAQGLALYTVRRSYFLASHKLEVQRQGVKAF